MICPLFPAESHTQQAAQDVSSFNLIYHSDHRNVLPQRRLPILICTLRLIASTRSSSCCQQLRLGIAKCWLRTHTPFRCRFTRHPHRLQDLAHFRALALPSRIRPTSTHNRMCAVLVTQKAVSFRPLPLGLVVAGMISSLPLHPFQPWHSLATTIRPLLHPHSR